MALTRTLYYDFSQSWNAGIDAGYAFIAEHEHPSYQYTADECRANFFTDSEGQPTSDVQRYTASWVPEVETMAPDPEWIAPDGRHAGLHPDGRTYIVTVSQNERIDDEPALLASRQLHVTSLDGKAYFYILCEP